MQGVLDFVVRFILGKMVQLQVNEPVYPQNMGLIQAHQKQILSSVAKVWQAVCSPKHAVAVWV